MGATLFELLMILSLGLLAGCGAGILIGLFTGTQKREWSVMPARDKGKTILLILACSSCVIGALAWYLYR